MSPRDTVLVSAADQEFGYHLLNLIGSVKANSDIFERIVVYDLGLNAVQRALLLRLDGVELRAMPPFVPHWAQCYTWKPWTWTHTDAENILYLDAGTTVLRSFAEPLEQIRTRGFFAVSQGHDVGLMLPPDYLDLYAIPDWLKSRVCAAAGVIGFRKSSPFYTSVIEPTFEDVVRGRNLGWSTRDAEGRNVGINRLDPLILRDCPIFRHDQTLLNIHFHKTVADPWLNDGAKYAGWLGPDQHPEQLLWHHRRAGNFAHLGRVGADGSWTSALASALAHSLRGQRWLATRWKHMRSPAVYVTKARRVATWLRARS